jgi:hypothetical protein
VGDRAVITSGKRVQRDRITAEGAHPHEITKLRRDSLGEADAPDLPIILIYRQFGDRPKVSGHIERLSLQRITNASQEIKGVAGWALDWAKESEFKSDCAPQRLESIRDNARKSLKQTLRAIEMLVSNRERRLSAILRRRESLHCELDGKT